MNTDDAKEIAQHVWRELPESAKYGRAEKFASVGTLDVDWCVENNGVRFFVGPDQVEGGGINWAIWFRFDDGWSAEGDLGGWAYGDTATAEKEIASVIAVMNR